MEANLFNLRDELLNGLYQHGQYSPFTIHDPKERSIHKATVRDRIVHQAIVNAIELVFERRFVFDSFSCRKYKGTHAASYRLRSQLRRASGNNSKTVYALKCDIRKFFDSLDHEILLQLILTQIQCSKTVSLLQHIVSGFNTQDGKGVPIGNLTSQLFANIYLHEFDHFIKQRLKIKWYLRYCDDFVILDTSRESLIKLIPVIKGFLQDTLKLEIHPHKISLRTWNQGIDFVGYVHLPHCTVLRTRTRKRMIRQIRPDNIASYMGMCQHADTYQLQQLLLNKLSDEIAKT